MILLALLLLPLPAPLPQDSAAAAPPSSVLRLETLDLSAVEQDWGRAQAARSVDGHPLRIGGRTFAHGLGTHAEGEFEIDLHGTATEFLASAGVDDEVGKKGSVVFSVWVDDRESFRSPVLHGGDAPLPIAVDLTGAKRLALVLGDGGDGIDYDHADWAEARLRLAPDRNGEPRAVRAAPEPPPSIRRGLPARPWVHAPRITGATPGRPFLFRIPATGEKPLRFAAENLPAGITLDPQTGILRGALRAAGRTEVLVTVEGPGGSDRASLTIVGEPHALALTPPMGWNSWNVWGTAVDDARVRQAADALVASGLADLGFQYVNIDDTWEGERDADGRIRSNAKFPDMRALSAYLHERGLKLGIYSSPGPKTCAAFEGSFQHEASDARTWAAWGIDYVKYDWCSYGKIAPDASRASLRKPYDRMRAALDAAGRDIVFSLCQYGMGNVAEWGASVGGNLWRTTGDITDSWSSMARIGFGQAGLGKYAGPGHWNDPDMLVVGRLGWGENLHPSGLDPNEQITHMTLWALLAAPLLIGCDLTHLDDFTLALLSNPEVLEVDQDALGRGARRVAVRGHAEIWARPLADGTIAVGLFNRGRHAAELQASWKELGLNGPQRVRNLWTGTDEGVSEDVFRTRVPRHGAVLLKIGAEGDG